MWEASYGKEPFDLRLTALRLIRNLNMIFALTVLGTLLFGGGYYVKNVLLGPAPAYSVTSTYKVQYVAEPAQAGDYYINETTWDSLVHTEAFLQGVQKHLQELAAEGIASELSMESLSAMLTAKLPSDWHIPTTTVVTEQPEKSMLIAAAVELTMEQEFVEMMGSEVASVQVLSHGTAAEEVLPDVRPFRAFVLSAIISLFFITVVFLLKETGDDSIWLPATLRRRYGLRVLGTLESPELAENISYFFRGKKRIAVCTVDERIDPAEAAKAIAAKAPLQEPKKPEEQKSAKVSAQNPPADSREDADNGLSAETSQASHTWEWLPMPTPLLSPEVCRTLREMDGILLVVPAGAHAGKALEYVKEMLEQQDCNITAVILWKADEWLIRLYYGYCFRSKFPKGQRKES